MGSPLRPCSVRLLKGKQPKKKKKKKYIYIYMYIYILIIKITISSLVIGLKKAYFPLISLPSCYRTVCYWIVCYWTVCYRTVKKANHIQSVRARALAFVFLLFFLFCFCILMRTFPFFHNLAIFL